MSAKNGPRKPGMIPAPPPTIPPQQRKIELVPTEDTFDVYSNFSDVNWSLHDLTFRFGQITPMLKDSDTWIADEKVRVTVAWAYAKALNAVLTHLVASYENVNGEIRQPKLAVSLMPAAIAEIVKGKSR